MNSSPEKKQKNTIIAIYNIIYKGCPWETYLTMVSSTGFTSSPPPLNPTNVAGKSRIELANIGGITPAVFNFKGM